MRSKLFVPAIRPELFAKAMASQADAVSFDLEDAVPADRKAQARAHLVEFLREPAALRKTIIVRVNASGTPDFQADLDALAGLPIDLINLPKTESADELRAAASSIARRWPQPPGLLVTIESARGLRHAAAIAGADASVAGLQLGLGDLFEALGIDRRNHANVHAAMYALRMAAAEAGVYAYDSAWGAIEDEAGFRTEAQQARALGFLGKSCIHPRQVALANALFQPTEEEIAAARRIVAAAAEANTRGHGAFVVDGRMIDAPYLRRAQAIVAAADA
ncbi:HpcH/HpaI aldolase/citrate lyase family protein [Pseudoxanthomonas indica]|uniref:Citrate lyase subunit beta / citryl-CoA lyase n=1 Tax=Pseudoxanthomonas indica TaxID=428993 RepID=A0A1T5K309_9GAMM|nr:CoA ester lyase [Pseudoxanthomonas indica]GGD46157.1 citrate lyase subunit beta [Pseudoxanthomonas indica]SKC57940.1 citrate lyase subunit beta / citryl-CoA lyase [Pseudoxanthomonas indica]